jgi:hypothetical protein
MDESHPAFALSLALKRLSELTEAEQILVRVRADTVRNVAKESHYGLLAVVLVGTEILALTENNTHD